MTDDFREQARQTALRRLHDHECGCGQDDVVLVLADESNLDLICAAVSDTWEPYCIPPEDAFLVAEALRSVLARPAFAADERARLLVIADQLPRKGK